METESGIELPKHELIAPSSSIFQELVDNRGLRFEIADVFKDTPFEQLLAEGRISDATDGIQKVLKTEAEIEVTLPDGSHCNVPVEGEQVMGTIFIDGQRFTIEDYKKHLGPNISQNNLFNLNIFEQDGVSEVVVTRNGRLTRFDGSKDSIYISQNTGKE